MEFGKYKLMTDDHLKLIKFISSDIFQSTPIKILLGFIFAIHVIVDLITVYYMLSTFDAKLFINYASVFFGDFYPLLAIFVLLYKSKIIHNIRNELELWSIDNASKKLQFEIKLKIKCLNIFVIFNSLLLLLMGVTFVQPLSKDLDLFFAYRFIHEHVTNYGHIFEFLYRTTYLPFSYIGTVLLFQIFYYFQHANFQMQMTMEVFRKIGEWSEDDENLVDNSKYQTEINRRLKICIQRSQNFICLHCEKLKEISKFIAGFALCGCLMGISVIFYLISGNFMSEYYFRMGVISVSGITTFAATIWAGQSTESTIDDLVTSLNEVECMKERKIKFSENYSFNYKLGLAIVRGIYSVISIVL